MDYLKKNHLSILIIGFLVISKLFFGGSAPVNTTTTITNGETFGAINNATSTITNPFAFTQGFSVGATQTTANKISGINTGFCNIQAAANTITATSTVTVDCVAAAGAPPGTALAGVTTGDKIFLSQGTTTSTTVEGLTILGASASSTAGYITLKLFNGTGTTFTWTAAASSSWPYYAVR